MITKTEPLIVGIFTLQQEILYTKAVSGILYRNSKIFYTFNNYVYS